MDDKRAADVKLLVLDVDGVMTDGRITINEQGEEVKSFDVKDGLGLRLLMNAGIDVVIITGRKSKSVAYRAEELGIREVYQGVKDKGALFSDLVKRKKLEKEQVCCIGDDLPDLPLFQLAGVSVAVADAVSEVQNEAIFITKNRGGNGAVREVCDMILKARQKLQDDRSQRFKK